MWMLGFFFLVKNVKGLFNATEKKWFVWCRERSITENGIGEYYISNLYSKQPTWLVLKIERSPWNHGYAKYTLP